MTKFDILFFILLVKSSSILDKKFYNILIIKFCILLIIFSSNLSSRIWLIWFLLGKLSGSILYLFCRARENNHFFSWGELIKVMACPLAPARPVRPIR